MMLQKKLSEKGQTLLIVIFAMSLGLMVLVSVSSRAITSSARITQTNFYQKAGSAAEGGAENFLLKTDAQLSGLLGTCSPSALFTAGGFAASINSNCLYNLTQARAVIGVDTYPSANESLEVRGLPGETLHVSLAGMSGDTLKICWYGLDSTGVPAYSDSYYFLYSGSVLPYNVGRSIYRCNPFSQGNWCASLPGTYETNVYTWSDAEGAYSCYTVDVPSYPVALRIFTFPAGGYYKISNINPADGTLRSLPAQGYRITSVGEVTGNSTSLESRKATRKKVIVERSFPYPEGAWYDFALTSLDSEVRAI